MEGEEIKYKLFPDQLTCGGGVTPQLDPSIDPSMDQFISHRFLYHIFCLELSIYYFDTNFSCLCTPWMHSGFFFLYFFVSL